MKTLKTTLLFVSLFLVNLAFGQNISGPSSAQLNAIQTFTFNDGSTHNPPLGGHNWEASRGTITSHSVSGTTYTVTVQWTSAGAGYIRFVAFYNDPTFGWGVWPVETKNVSITSPPPTPPAPPTPVISSANTCTSATINAPGTPPSDVAWFWIDSPDGFFNGNLNPVSAVNDKTITSSGTVYLASQRISNGDWNESATSINVTVYPNTVGGSITSSTTARCGTGSVNVSLSGHTGTIDYWRYRYRNGSGGWSGWTTITNTDNVTSVDPWLTHWTGGQRTYEVQAYIQSGNCSGTTRTRTITVDPVTISGSVSSSVGSRCGSGSVSFSLSNHRGTIQRWEYQYRDGSGSWSSWNLITETDNQTSVNPWLTEWSGGQRTYKVRATIKSGVCSTLYSTRDVIINPSVAAPTLNGQGTICSGGTASLSTNSVHNQWYTTPTGGSPFHTGSGYSESLTAAKTYYVQGYNQYGCTNTTRTAFTVNVDTPPTGGTVQGSTEDFGIASGSLTASGYSGNIIRWESRTDIGWSTDTLSSTSASLPYYNLDETTEYRVIIGNGVCLNTASSDTAVVTVLDIPDVAAGFTERIRPAAGTTLSASTGHSNYEWFRNNVSVQNGSGNELVVSTPGTYKVTVTSSGGATYTTGDAVISNQLELNENAVVTYTYRVPVTDASDVFQYSTSEQSIAAQVYDGLGRPVQTIALQATPDEEDLVSPVEYDAYGRQAKSYLPYVDSDLTVLNKTNALNETYSASKHYDYYKNQSPYLSEYAYSETRFDASPLNRPVEQGAPGSPWQIGQNTMTYAYDVAAANEVVRFSFENLLTGAKVYFNANELYKNTTTDEDGNQTVEYTDKLGQTVLKKSQVDGSTWAETYYVYDIEGRLSAVIPPEAASRLDTEFFGQSQATRETFLNTWAFLYAYDGQDRMTAKKVPGADSVFMVYDRWDRLVLTQDGVQRSNNQWLFTKYDVLNRPVMTGLATITGTTAAVRSAVQASLIRAESFSVSGVNQYTDVTYPSNALVDDYLTVTYYDNYDWDTTGLAFTQPAGLTMDTLVRGQVTGTLTKTGNGSWIKSASYYDDKYRVIQTQSTNHLGGTDIVTNYYDFIGQVTSSISSHKNGSETTTITKDFTYDHAGRLLETWHKFDSASDSVLIAKNTYNELGELIEKDLHGETGGTFAQSLDYTYNIRGWLTSMNGSDLSASTDGDLFGMELFYNTNPLAAGNTNFNGNISAMQWSNPAGPGASNSLAYTYSYDKLNRLQTADHFEDNAPTDKYDVQGLNYDLNGNIESLQRRAASTSAFMDDLTYTYSGNQLTRVADAASDTTGFHDKYTGSIDYEYDANGNMTRDRNKEIQSITYNHLNLPVKVEFETAGDSILYLYDAAGIKLQQAVYHAGDTVKVTDYVGEFIYETDTSGVRKLQLVQHEEGRIIPKSPLEGGTGGVSYDYQYHLKDHLGNVRMTFSTTPENYTMVETFETGEENGWQDLHRFTNTSANTTAGGDEVELLQSGQTGAMIFINVNKGDTVDLSVNANYESAPTNNNFLGTTYTALFSSFDGAYGGSEGVSSTASDFNDALGGVDMSGKPTANGQSPKAYLNYIIFDKDMSYVTAGFQQISSAALGVGVHETISINDIIADRDGYILAYLSNENQEAVNIHFDDFTVYHGKTNVVSTQDYYPFGLTFNESSRVASTEQRYLFNGFESQKEWGVYDYIARQYDPTIGRFLQIDPLADFMRRHSPFAYAFDNPIRFIDPDGMMPEEVGKGPCGDQPCPENTSNVHSVETGEPVTTHTGITQTTTYSIPGVNGSMGLSASETKVIENRPYDVAGGVNMPSTIETVDADGNAQTVTVNMGSGFGSDNNHTPDNKISQAAVNGYTEGVKKANEMGAGIESVTISATTNGNHGNPNSADWDTSDSNHYVRMGARAIDTDKINGANPSASDSTTIKFQMGMDSVSNIRENFGPVFKHKNLTDHPVSGHSTWIHNSFNNN